MKESIVYPTEYPVANQDECSEEKCSNCFANSGCLYDHASITNLFSPKIDLLHQLNQTKEYGYRAVVA